MPSTLQQFIVAHLEQSGCRTVKHLAGKCIVMTATDNPGYHWYIGPAGSLRYGRTRTTSAPAPKRFYYLTGVKLEDVRLVIPGTTKPPARLKA